MALNWLCDQLGEYLERWLGFAKMERIPIKAMIGNKLYFVVVAAINVIGNRLERVKAQPGCPTKEWDEFKNAVEWVRQVADRDELGIVESTFATFSQKISQRVGSK
jgi:hypothetical protein